MKVLIAYDGSENADRMLDDLQRAGLQSKLDAVVISAADVFMPPAPPEDYDPVETALDRQIKNRALELRKKANEAVEQARELALAAARRLEESFPGWNVEAESVADSPAWAIVQKAEMWNADLIVAGSHGRSSLGRFFLGSVSQTIVKEAPCSVRIARGPINEGEDHLRIAIGMDGSAGASVALNAMATREWPKGTQARVIAVLDQMIVTSVEWVKEGDANEEVWVRRMVDASVERLEKAGLEVSSRIIYGDVKRVLVSEAEQWGADTIFVGARGLRRIERFFLGSVSTAVAARAHCSVEVVRAQQKG